MSIERKYKLKIQNFADATMNFEDIFNQKTLIDYSSNFTYKPFLGDQLFPNMKTADLKVAFNELDTLMPVVASVHGFDTKAEIGSREGFAQLEMEKILIKRQLPIREELLINLTNPRTNSEFQQLIGQLFDDVRKLTMGVLARCEAMKMEMLATGKITIDENEVNVTLDYEVPATHKETLSDTDLWSDYENSDPISDIMTWTQTIIDDTGITPRYALTSSKVASILRQHPKVQSAINGANYAGKLVTLSDVNALLGSLELPTIATYDEQYRKETHNKSKPYEQKRYFPVDTFVIFPEENLGNGVFGDTPESRLLTRKGFDVSSIGNVTITRYSTEDPANEWTKATGLFVPTFPAYKNVFQAKVIEVD